jgi:hypothetical protein
MNADKNSAPGGVHCRNLLVQKISRFQCPPNNPATYQSECRRLIAVRRRREEIAARTAYPRINPITSPMARTSAGSTLVISCKSLHVLSRFRPKRGARTLRAFASRPLLPQLQLYHRHRISQFSHVPQKVILAALERVYRCSQLLQLLGRTQLVPILGHKICSKPMSVNERRNIVPNFGSAVGAPTLA